MAYARSPSGKLDHGGRTSDVLVSLACDYLTVTGVHGHGVGDLHGTASSIFKVEADRGNRIKPWGMSGFKGWRCGGVEIGKRESEVIVRLSGDCAALNWSRIYELANNCSRIDIQATVKTEECHTRRIEMHKRQARRFASKRGDKPIVRWVQEHKGGYTLYVGSRSSNCFGRIYDCWAKHKLDHYVGTVRYEAQYQHDLAPVVARKLLSSNSAISVMSSHCSQVFKARGVDAPVFHNAQLTSCLVRQRSDCDRNLLWLAKAVRPCVERLIALGKGEEVLTALGLVVHDGPSAEIPTVDHLSLEV